MRVLGIDYGTKYIGLAYLDTANQVSLPLAELTLTSKAQALNELALEIKEREVEKLVFGLPLSFQFEETLICVEIREFAEALADLTGVKLDYINEVLTSDLARVVSGKPAKDNSLAAKLILDDYLIKHLEHREN